MNGSNFLVDTNFLIYLLNGKKVVTPYLNNNFFISEITEMEMLGVRGIPLEILKVRSDLIDNCYCVTFNSDIKEIAIHLKQQYVIKLPDAIVAASALYMSLPLVTADKSFRKIDGLDIRILKL